VIYLDFDGVICDLVGGFLNHLWFKKRLVLAYEDVIEYNIPKALAKALKGNGQLEVELDTCFQEFLHDYDGLVNTVDPVRPIWKAMRQVGRRSLENGQPHGLSICTARTGVALAAAQQWCQLWGLEWVPFVAPPDGYKKLDLLQAGDVLVEDNFAVAEAALRLGTPGTIVLVEWPWSRHMARSSGFRELALRPYKNAYGTVEEVAHWLRKVSR